MAWKTKTLATVVNGWSMNTDTMGVYGVYYLKRAIVANIGLGANLVDDAVYPFNVADDTGQPLDGSSEYTFAFRQGRHAAHQLLQCPSRSTRLRRLPGRQFNQPLRGEQLDAVQEQSRRLPCPLHPERRAREKIWK